VNDSQRISEGQTPSTLIATQPSAASIKFNVGFLVEPCFIPQMLAQVCSAEFGFSLVSYIKDFT